jgi:hypothetical protein
MRVSKLSSAPRTDQLAVSSLAPYPQTQGLGGFIDFVSGRDISLTVRSVITAETTRYGNVYEPEVQAGEDSNFQ